MKENYVEVPLLQQREIEMKILGPIVRAFAAEIGEEITYDIVRRTMQSISRDLGTIQSKRFGDGLENLKSSCISKWSLGGELETIVHEDSSDILSFDVTRCEFANLYNDLGYGKIGALISCDRDAAFLEGFDPTLELIRDKTLMDGDSLCNFCYRKKVNN